MADSSSLWFSPSFHALRGARSGSPDANPLRRKLAFLRSRPSPSSSSPAPSLPKLKSLVLRGRRSPRPRAKESDDEGGCFGDDPYGPYPWESSVFSDGPTIEWVPEDRITLFTSEGLIQIGGSLVPRRFPQKRQGKSQVTKSVQRFQESDYMDPNQGLCLGALFDIAATNGLDMGRRLCIFGFCRSIEMLSDVVEDTIVEHGGEVVTAEKVSNEGLLEKLTMTVVVPLLWGVPPASDTLRFAVRSGGGIVEKVYWQWNFL
ncbi:hypothetical protein MUK42_18814 [Musa troglodytarum]|uniref:DUF7811 domain-containing protein n=1 Tax=Musa troglodytarum TaxID=320322 RepID=A0A9E7EK46_9LILI|nr:hypothetical protein MUK42_07946 [Musa troglodytarum]URD81725.1 hypothetical protein MUK42_18814 [Musa troglodytarum]